MPGVGLFSDLTWLAVLLPSIAVQVRRLHDIDRTGWWWWIVLVPLLGWILLLVWDCTPGTEGPNRYGDDPLGPGLAAGYVVPVTPLPRPLPQGEGGFCGSRPLPLREGVGGRGRARRRSYAPRHSRSRLPSAPSTGSFSGRGTRAILRRTSSASSGAPRRKSHSAPPG